MYFEVQKCMLIDFSIVSSLLLLKMGSNSSISQVTSHYSSDSQRCNNYNQQSPSLKQKK